jgi:hypothetical protein
MWVGCEGFVKVLGRGRDHCGLLALPFSFEECAWSYPEMSSFSALFERILPALVPAVGG